MNFNLSQHSFSTILLDAIQFFPQDVQKQAESHGLLFGLGAEESIECDYIFPVGNVRKRSKNEISPNRTIDHAIETARQLISTSRTIGTYHSHPYKEKFADWADPSNMDVAFAKYIEAPFMLIIAIARGGNEEKPLKIQYGSYTACRFVYDEKADGHDAPIVEELNGQSQSIYGEFKKYQFEVRAYHFDGENLQDVPLYSSEAEVLMELLDEEIDLAQLSEEHTYSLRKIEFNLRTAHQSSRAADNLDYHLRKVKESVQRNRNTE